MWIGYRHGRHVNLYLTKEERKNIKTKYITSVSELYTSGIEDIDIICQLHQLFHLGLKYVKVTG